MNKPIILALLGGAVATMLAFALMPGDDEPDADPSVAEPVEGTDDRPADAAQGEQPADTDATATQGNDAATATTDPLRDAGLIEKVNALITASSALDDRMIRSFGRHEGDVFADTLPSTEGFAFREGRRTPYDMEERYADAMADAANRTPAVEPLDALANAVAVAAADYAAFIGPLIVYYERAAYEEDDWARGREAHPEMVALIERYRAASGAFDDALRTQLDLMRQAEAAELRANGFALQADLSQAMDTARRLVGTAAALRDGQGGPEASAMVRADLAELAALTDRIAAAAGAGTDGAESMDSFQVFGVSQWTEEANAMIGDGRRFLKRLETDDFPTNRPASIPADGTPEMLFKRFSAMVEHYNRAAG